MLKSRTAVLSVFIGLFCIVAIWALFLHLVGQEKKDIADGSETQARQASVYFKETIEARLRYADAYAQAVRKEYIAGGASLDRVRAFMSLFPLDREIASHVTIANHTGMPIFLSTGGGEISPTATLADRDYFRQARDAKEDISVISMAQRGRNTGKSILRVVRRLNHADGSFAGVVFTAVEAERTVGVVTALGLGFYSSGALIGTTDKLVRARFSAGKFDFGQNLANSSMWALLEKSPAGHFRQTSLIDGITRHFYYQKIDGFPLIGIIGVAETDLAKRREEVMPSLYIAAATLTVLILSLVLFILRREAARERLIGATEALRQGEAQLRLITDTLPAEINFTDRDNIIRFANLAYARRHGFESPAELIGRSRGEIWGADDHADIIAGISNTLAGAVTQVERRRVDPDGAVRHLLFTRAPQRDPNGVVTGYVSIGQDITHSKEMEAALAQSQKMEAIGQLTGGIAHDFNNLLAVIMGNAELAAGQAPTLNREMTTIMHASKRGAELTQRLLAFSRRQSLQPCSVHLPDMVQGLMDLLKRTLGETIDIQTHVTKTVPPVMVDPGQLENVILNLAINSRDAMPRGGALAIEMSEIDLREETSGPDDALAPGTYVVLAVSDTGFGMTEDVRKHAIEPFFTTKDVGKGSGLGLSMAYGFARQSGGHLTIYSEPGIGTTIKIYLPVTNAGTAPREAADLPAAPPFARGEKILLVEDDPEVLRLVSSMLRTLDYAVVTAPDARTALSLLENGETVDLLLSDVVLPGGISGPELGGIVLSRWPRTKVLFVSGYPAHAALNHDTAVDLGDQLLAKPFTRTTLAHKLRSVLDS